MKPWHIAGLVVLGLIALAIGSVSLQLSPVAPTGSYAVGRTMRLWIDSSRPEPMTETTSDVREIPVQVWYPAQAGGGSAAPYFPDLKRVADALVASGEVSAPEVFGLRLIQSRERLDAPPPDDGKAYPVLLFSPGNGTEVEFYDAFAAEFASHGWIVIGVNHAFDVAAVGLSGNRIAQFIEGPLSMEARRPWIEARVRERAADLLFVLRSLPELNESDPILRGRFDLTHIGAAGHSLGAITAAQACYDEPHIGACLNIDGLQRGGPFGAAPVTAPPAQPFMMITKEKTLAPDIVSLFQASSRTFLVVASGAAHDDFVDVNALIPSVIPMMRSRTDEVVDITRAYALAFFHQMLLNEPSRLLEKPMADAKTRFEIYPR